MHALILMTVLAQWAPREAPHYGHVRESRRMGNRSLVGQGYAFFEAFPLSGAGTTSACSTTAPTGAKGETLTFTRTGNATCSKKGLATTGIADGDLVVMSSNVARVEPDSDGVLGLRVEGARTNAILRSQEFDNASWSKTAVAPLSVVGVWPNDAGAPDGTQTAEAVHFEATAAGQASRIFQSTLSVGVTYGCGVYVRSARPMDGGVATAGSIDFIIDKGTTGGFSCSTCAHTPDSWSRCEVPGGVISGSIGSLLIGNDSRPSTCGNGPRASSQDVLLWQADCHSGGTYVTSPIPTGAAAVTRNEESASFPVAIAGPEVCLASTLTTPYATPPHNTESSSLHGAANTPFGVFYSGGWRRRNGPSHEAPPQYAHAVPIRLVQTSTGATTGEVCANAACTTMGATGANTTGITTLQVGYGSWTGARNGAINSRIQVDPSATRCTP